MSTNPSNRKKVGNKKKEDDASDSSQLFRDSPSHGQVKIQLAQSSDDSMAR